MSPDTAHAPCVELNCCVHEVREALAAITWASEVLARIEPPHELALEACAVVRRQASHLSRLIAELMAHVQQARDPVRVLAVSDDAHLLATLGGMLAAQDCHVDLAASGEDALRVLMPRRHDVALIDVRTSRSPGVGLAHRARDMGFDGRLVALWDAGSEHCQPAQAAAGFDLVLTCAIEAAALRAAIAGGGPGGEDWADGRAWRHIGREAASSTRERSLQLGPG